MKKKAKQKPISLDIPKTIEEYGERLVRLGEALQDENTKIRNLMELSLSCGLILSFSLVPKLGARIERTDAKT